MGRVRNATDPRAARSRVAMLAAAREILQREGPGAVTLQRVAQLAGVGRATAYRHWPKSEQLLLEAMAGVEMPFFREPAIPVRPWLHDQLCALAGELRMPVVAATAGILIQGSLWDPEIAKRRDAFVGTLTDQLRPALDLAVATAELDTRWNAHDAAALLVGPILFRATLQAGDIAPDLVDRLLDSLGTWQPDGTAE